MTVFFRLNYLKLLSFVVYGGWMAVAVFKLPPPRKKLQNKITKKGIRPHPHPGQHNFLLDMYAHGTVILTLLKRLIN